MWRGLILPLLLCLQLSLASQVVFDLSASEKIDPDQTTPITLLAKLWGQPLSTSCRIDVIVSEKGALKLSPEEYSQSSYQLLSRPLEADEVPTYSKPTEIEISVNLPKISGCGFPAVAMAITCGEVSVQNFIPYEIKCDEDVDLELVLPAESYTIEATGNGKLTSSVEVELKNNGPTALASRLYLDAVSFHAFLIPGYYALQLEKYQGNTDYTPAEISQEILSNWNQIRSNDFEYALEYLVGVKGLETFMADSTTKKGRVLDSGGRFTLPLSDLTVDPNPRAFSGPAALIISFDNFGHLKDKNPANNEIALLVNYQNSGSMKKTQKCFPLPDPLDVGKSAVVLSKYNMPFKYENSNGGFSRMDVDVKTNIMVTDITNQIAARLKAIDKCKEEVIAKAEGTPVSGVAMARDFMGKMTDEVETLVNELQDPAKSEIEVVHSVMKAITETYNQMDDGPPKSRSFLTQLAQFKTTGKLRKIQKLKKIAKMIDKMGKFEDTLPNMPPLFKLFMTKNSKDEEQMSDWVNGLKNSRGSQDNRRQPGPMGTAASVTSHTVHQLKQGPTVSTKDIPAYGDQDDGSFICRSGQVVQPLLSKIGCDGIPDCVDKSDEDPMYCATQPMKKEKVTRTLSQDSSRDEKETRPYGNDELSVATLTSYSEAEELADMLTDQQKAVLVMEAIKRGDTMRTELFRRGPRRGGRRRRRRHRNHSSSSWFPKHNKTRRRPSHRNRTRRGGSRRRFSRGFMSIFERFSGFQISASVAEKVVTTIDNSGSLESMEDSEESDEVSFTFDALSQQLRRNKKNKKGNKKSKLAGKLDGTSSEESIESAEDSSNSTEDSTETFDGIPGSPAKISRGKASKLNDITGDEVFDDDDSPEDDDLYSIEYDSEEYDSEEYDSDEEDFYPTDDDVFVGYSPDEIFNIVSDSFSGNQEKLTERAKKAKQRKERRTMELKTMPEQMDSMRMGMSPRDYDEDSDDSKKFYMKMLMSLFGKRPHKNPCLMEKAREMKDLFKKMCMRFITTEPEDMDEYDFLPLSYRRTLKDVVNKMEEYIPMNPGEENMEPPKIPGFISPWITGFQTIPEVQMVPRELGRAMGEGIMKDLFAKKFPITEERINFVLDFFISNVSVVLKDNLPAEMADDVDVSVRLLEILKKNSKEIALVAHEVAFMTLMPEMYLRDMDGKPKREPTSEERCMSISQERISRMKNALWEEEKSVMYEDATDMVGGDMEKKVLEFYTRYSPAYWEVEDGKILRGHYSEMFGQTLWKAVAVCNCEPPPPPPMIPGMPPNFHYDMFPDMPSQMNPHDMNIWVNGLDGMGGGEFGSGNWPDGRRFGGEGSGNWRDGSRFGGEGSGSDETESGETNRGEGETFILGETEAAAINNFLDNLGVNRDQIGGGITPGQAVPVDQIKDVLKNIGADKVSPDMALNFINNIKFQKKKETVVSLNSLRLLNMKEKFNKGKNLTVTGTVVITKDGKTSRICNEGWGSGEAKVVCSTIGAKDPRIAKGNFKLEGFRSIYTDIFKPTFSNSNDYSPPIYITDVECDSSDTNASDILHCRHIWNTDEKKCVTREAASITCFFAAT